MTCIGCGYCCLKAKCIAGARLYGVSDNTCEALVFDEKDQRHKCKLVMFGNSLSDHYKNELHIGEGCCSSMNTWRKEPIQNRIPKIYVTTRRTLGHGRRLLFYLGQPTGPPPLCDTTHWAQVGR